jgi:hypothetical protein
MAGSFDIFRKYQRSLLVFVAILAMLAFFVLPPILQMGVGGPAGDPVAVTWKDGAIREAELDRAVAMRTVVNRFLAESAMAAGRDPSQLPLFADSEEQVVRSMMLAKEAAANGLVVSDSAINDFLGQWTNNLVRPDQFRDIIAGLRLGPMGVSQRDVFDALRTELAARNMFLLFQTGFSGDPPGWRWEYFCRLERQATIEAVPVVVESVVGDVPEPTVAELRSFFEQYKDDLPEPRSTDPGFREPHRVKFQYLVAKRETFLDKAKAEVTDAEIADYYEKNKATMFRERPKPPTEPTDANDKVDDESAAAAAAKPVDDQTAEEKPANTKPEDKAAEPQTDDMPKPTEDGDKQGAAKVRQVFQPVSFRQPAEEKPTGVSAEDGADPTPTAKSLADAAEAKAGASPETKPTATPEAVSGEKPAGTTGAEIADTADPKPDNKPPAEEPKFEPLENVTDEIRNRLAAERADRTIDAIFSAVAGDMTAYAEDFALWQAQQEKGAAPQPPDFDTVAEKQGLEAGQSELVAADEAVAGGGIGQSFEFVPDPSSRFGLRQRNWLEQIYGESAPSLRPVTSRDVAGNRYISWKLEDQPEFTPSFETARPRVEQAWKIVEGRAIAEKKAAALAAEATTKSLTDVVAGQNGLEVAQVGPFSWLSQGTVPQGTPPLVSDPAGLIMPGDELMEAVFALEPGQTATAFNEPQTICYAIRMESVAPSLEDLEKRFLETKDDQRRIAMVAQREFSTAITDWLEGLEAKYAVEWKREPRRSDR